MNEPIRCRALISLVARYPSNQREMNSHCGVTETKMMAAAVEKETRGYQHKSFTFFTEGQSSISSHQIFPYVEFLMLCVIEAVGRGVGEGLIDDALGHTLTRFIQNFTSEAINDVLFTTSLSEKQNIPSGEVLRLDSETNCRRACKLGFHSPSSMMLTTTPSPVRLLHHAGITLRSRPRMLYSPCAN